MTVEKFLLNNYEALIFKLELTVKQPYLEQSGMIWQREKILPLAEFVYCPVVEKTISGKDEVKIDLPLAGVYMEGWMNLNPEFLTLNYNFEDDKNAFIRCKLGKSMEVG